MPEIKTRESLTDVLTTIIFLATAQHGAVNIGQAEYYGYVPNRPLRLHKGMPGKFEFYRYDRYRKFGNGGRGIHCVRFA